jgi:hypothetical protein
MVFFVVIFIVFSSCVGLMRAGADPISIAPWDSAMGGFENPGGRQAEQIFAFRMVKA